MPRTPTQSNQLPGRVDSLRTRVFLILLALIGAYVVINIPPQRMILTARFRSIEDRLARRQAARFLQSLQVLQSESIQELSLVRASAPDPHSGRLDAMAAYDERGAKLWEHFSASSRSSTHPARVLPERLLGASDLAPDTSVGWGVHGTHLGPAMLACRSIVHPETGVKSILVGALLMDASRLGDLALMANLDLRVASVSGFPSTRPATLPSKPIAFAADIKQVSVKEISDTSVSVTVDLIGGDMLPAARVSLVLPRETREEEESALQWMIASIFAAGLLILVVILVLMQSLVTGPILGLARRVISVAELGVGELAPDQRRGDEIGLLAREFGATIEKLERRELELEKSERRFRTLVENSQVGICIIGEWKMQYASPRLATMLGTSQAEMIHLPDAADIFVPEDRLFIRETLDRAHGSQPGTAVHLPVRCIGPGGRSVEMEMLASVVDFAGSQVLLLSLLDVTDRHNLERAVQESTENERRRFGQDLHDGLGQYLTAISFRLEVLSERLARRQAPEQKDVIALGSLVKASVSQTRDLAKMLFPVDLEKGGLRMGLEDLANYVRQQLGAECILDLARLDEDLSTHESLHFYRIAQEAVSNAVRHGKATRIEISMISQARYCRLEVTDNGVGMPTVDTPQKGLGLRLMGYRARMMHAELQIARRTGGGVRVICEIHRQT